MFYDICLTHLVGENKIAEVHGESAEDSVEVVVGYIGHEAEPPQRLGARSVVAADHFQLFVLGFSAPPPADLRHVSRKQTVLVR